MASKASEENELEMVQRALMPLLEQAAIGHFERDIEIDPSHPTTVNELLTGVQVLLEAVRERGLEIERLRAELRQTRTPIGLINELMDGSGRKEL